MWYGIGTGAAGVIIFLIGIIFRMGGECKTIGVNETNILRNQKTIEMVAEGIRRDNQNIQDNNMLIFAEIKAELRESKRRDEEIMKIMLNKH